MILDNRWIPIRAIDDDIGISVGSCQAIFMDILGMKRKILKKNTKKQRRMDIAHWQFRFAHKGEESWVYDYDIVTKSLAFQWKCPEDSRQKITLQVRSNVKVLLTVFFDCKWRGASGIFATRSYGQ